MSESEVIEIDRPEDACCASNYWHVRGIHASHDFVRDDPARALRWVLELRDEQRFHALGVLKVKIKGGDA